MYKSVFSKYLSIISLVVVVGFLAMTTFQVFFTANALAEDKRVLLSENVQTIAQYYADTALYIGQYEGTPVYQLDNDPPMLKPVAEAIDATILITDPTGKVLLTAGNPEAKKYENAISLKKLLSKVEDDFYEVGYLGGLYENRHYTAAVTIVKGDRVLGYVFASAPANAFAQTLRSNIRIYLYSVLGALVLSLAFVWLMTERFVRPLRQMAAASHSFAQGDFSARVKVKGKDEVAQLGEALNNMAISLSSVEIMRRSFIANVSHELKTPMTTIAGFIDGMLDGTIPPEKQGQYMKIVSDEVKRLSRLVRSMLDLSRIDSGEIKMNTVRMDLTEIVGSVLVASEQRIEQKRLTITGLEDCQRQEICGDYDLMNQVLYNLLDNAIKFTNDGGNIHIRLYREQGRVYVSIRNSGDGIPPEEMPRIFERFYKSDRSRSLDKNGVGLGLYIVHTVVRLHGGEISVCSKQGEYTEFAFWVPEPTNGLAKKA